MDDGSTCVLEQLEEGIASAKLPQEFWAAIDDAVAQYPDDLAEAKKSARDAVRGLACLEEIMLLLVDRATNRAVDERRHQLNRAISSGERGFTTSDEDADLSGDDGINGAGICQHGPGPATRNVSLSAAGLAAKKSLDLFGKFIDGTRIGDATADDLARMRDTSIAQASGNLHNAEFCELLRKTVKPGMKVSQCIDGKKISQLYKQALRRASGWARDAAKEIAASKKPK